MAREVSLEDFTNTLSRLIREDRETMMDLMIQRLERIQPIKTEEGQEFNERQNENILNEEEQPTEQEQIEINQIVRQEQEEFTNKIIDEFENLQVQYIKSQDDTTRNMIEKLDLLKKMKLQDEVYKLYMKGKPKSIQSGFIPTSIFTNEKTLETSKNGNPISKTINFENGIPSITIKNDGMGKFICNQNGKTIHFTSYKKAQEWAYRGGYNADELKLLKDYFEYMKNPRKTDMMIFSARKQ